MCVVNVVDKLASITLAATCSKLAEFTKQQPDKASIIGRTMSDILDQPFSISENKGLQSQSMAGQ